MKNSNINKFTHEYLSTENGNTHNQWQVNLIIVCELLIVLNDVWEINKYK